MLELHAADRNREVDVAQARILSHHRRVVRRHRLVQLALRAQVHERAKAIELQELVLVNGFWLRTNRK